MLSKLICTGVTLIFCFETLLASDWPQWRGPDRTGHVPAGVAVPTTLPAEPKILWRVKVGDGLSSPVVAGGKVFHLDNQDGKETVHALDALTGKPLWSAELDDAFKDSQSPAGPRCTPLVNDGRVYAQSCRGELKCLDAKDGKLIWRVNYVTDFGAEFTGEKGQSAGAVRHGYNGSPFIEGEHLITCAGGTNGASVVCLNKKTGAAVWKSGSDTASYAPPILAQIGGRRQVVAFTVDSLSGLDLRDGKLLWQVPLKTKFGRHVTTPVVLDDMVMVSSHEFGLIGVQVLKSGNDFSASVAWTNKAAAINFASPVMTGGHLYGIGPVKDVVCVEAKSGKLAWSKDGLISTTASKAHAGFIGMGSNVLLLTDSGELLLLAADANECREIGRAQVSGSNWCNPAYADGRLYLRDGKDLISVALLP